MYKISRHAPDILGVQELTNVDPMEKECCGGGNCDDFSGETCGNAKADRELIGGTDYDEGLKALWKGLGLEEKHARWVVREDLIRFMQGQDPVGPLPPPTGKRNYEAVHDDPCTPVEGGGGLRIGSPKVIFYNKDVFKMGKDAGGERLSGCFELRSNTDRTAQWVVLEHKANGKLLLVVNTHLTHGSEPEDSAFRLTELRSLRSTVGALQGELKGAATVILGDMNYPSCVDEPKNDRAYSLEGSKLVCLSDTLKGAKYFDDHDNWNPRPNTAGGIWKSGEGTAEAKHRYDYILRDARLKSESKDWVVDGTAECLHMPGVDCKGTKLQYPSDHHLVKTRFSWKE